MPIVRHAPQVPTVTVLTRDDVSVMTQRIGEVPQAVSATGSTDAVMSQAVKPAW